MWKKEALVCSFTVPAAGKGAVYVIKNFSVGNSDWNLSGRTIPEELTVPDEVNTVQVNFIENIVY